MQAETFISACTASFFIIPIKVYLKEYDNVSPTVCIGITMADFFITALKQETYIIISPFFFVLFALYETVNQLSTVSSDKRTSFL